MDEKLLKQFAKMITLNCVRNTVIEDYHARGSLSQEDMKAFNIEVCSHIYTALHIYLKGTKQERAELLYLWSWMGGISNWDDPEINKNTMEALKQLKQNFPEVSEKIGQFFKSKKGSKKACP